MRILKVNALRGPNVWANFPVLEAWVELEELAETSSEMIPGFNDRMMHWLPTLIEHRCSVGERGGFFERLRRGTYMAHILEHVALELQTLAGTDVGFGRARETSTDGTYRVAVEYDDETLGRAALEAAFGIVLAAVHDSPIDVAAEIAMLRDIANDVCLGPSTRAIVDAAKARAVPYRRLNSGSLVQFGHGVKQRRIIAAETDRTSAIAESIAQDKQLTRTLLAAIGVPVPEGRPVTDAEDALRAADELGFPVVVKPQSGNHGRGVATNLTTREQVLAAYAAASHIESSVVVERHAPGLDHRLLVIGDRLIAAARREPAHVIGDGRSSVRELIDEVNRDPRRSDGHGTVLSHIKLDEVALGVLADQGMTPDSTPAAGAYVPIRRNGNLSTGGTATDVTCHVHPDTVRQAIEAVRMVGLDIAGLDVVCRDIAAPLSEQGGVVVEVNAGPGLRMHLQPSAGRPQPVGEAIVDLMFRGGDNGRIPIVAVTGVNGKTTTTRLVAHILAVTGKCVGMTCTDGIYVGSRRIDAGDCSGPKSAQAVLMNPSVEAAVLETARGGIVREGLGFDRCDVSIVTNIGEGDHLGLADIHTLDQLAKVKRVIVEATSSDGAAVLKADDAHVAAMSEKCPGKTVFFALNGEHEVIVAHRLRGGRAVFMRDNSIVLADGANEFALLSFARIPLTHEGRIAFQVENVLAAAGACWALGVPAEQIRAGLESFSAQMDKAPARFNLFEINSATVVVDYGHNVSSLAAIIETLSRWPHPRRTAVYSAAGDRRDEDMIRQGELLGASFDRVVLYEDQYRRGRQTGEIIGLFKQGLAASQRAADVGEFQSWAEAVRQVLTTAGPGDLLLIQADEVDAAVDFIRQFSAEHFGCRELKLDDALHPDNAARATSRTDPSPNRG